MPVSQVDAGGAEHGRQFLSAQSLCMLRAPSVREEEARMQVPPTHASETPHGCVGSHAAFRATVAVHTEFWQTSEPV